MDRYRTAHLDAEVVSSSQWDPVTCPLCGRGKVSPAVATEMIRVGLDAVEVTVDAQICSYCCEKWYDPSAQAIIDAAVHCLRSGERSQLHVIGRIYRAP